MATAEEMEAFMTVIYYTPAINNDLDTTSSATLWPLVSWPWPQWPYDPSIPRPSAVRSGYTATSLILITGDPEDCFKNLLNSLTLGDFNSLRPRQNGRHFTDDTFKRIFLNENV